MGNYGVITFQQQQEKEIKGRKSLAEHLPKPTSFSNHKQ